MFTRQAEIYANYVWNQCRGYRDHANFMLSMAEIWCDETQENEYWYTEMFNRHLLYDC